MSSGRIISFFETGERAITLSLAIKFAEIFNCIIDYLLFLSNVRNNKIEINKNYIGVFNDCDKNDIPPEQLQHLVSALKNIKKME